MKYPLNEYSGKLYLTTKIYIYIFNDQHICKEQEAVGNPNHFPHHFLYINTFYTDHM